MVSACQASDRGHQVPQLSQANGIVANARDVYRKAHTKCHKQLVEKLFQPKMGDLGKRMQIATQYLG